MGKILEKFLNKKIAIAITGAFIALSATTISVYAYGNCGGSSCGCVGSGSEADRNQSCASPNDCWYNSSTACVGHQWKPNEATYGSWYETGRRDASCTVAGYINYARDKTIPCGRCDATRRDTETSSTTIDPYHIMSGWRDEAGHSQHKKYCTRGCGLMDDYDPHNWKNGEWSQRGDGYQHNECTICPHHCTKPNQLKIRFYGNGGTVNGQDHYDVLWNMGETYKPSTLNARRPGYTFMGFDMKQIAIADSPNVSYVYETNVLANTTYTLDKFDSRILWNKYVEAVGYAQWQKTITYNINYLNTAGTISCDTIVVNYQNYAEYTTISSLNPGTTYNIDWVSGSSFAATNDTPSGWKSISSYKTSGTKNIYTQADNSRNAYTYSDWYGLGIKNADKDSITKDTANSSAQTIYIASIPSSINEVSNVAGTVNYYASYERIVTNKYYYYGNTYDNRDKIYLETQTDKAGLRADGVVDKEAVFTFNNPGTMYYTENYANTHSVKEGDTWVYVGWSTNNKTEFKKYNTLSTGNNEDIVYSTENVKAGSSTKTYIDKTYHADYTKTLTITFNPNNSNMTTQNGVMKNMPAINSGDVTKFNVVRTTNTITFTRHANAKPPVTRTTVTDAGTKLSIFNVDYISFNLPEAECAGQTGLVYTHAGWLFGSGQTNTNCYANLISNNTTGENLGRNELISGNIENISLALNSSSPTIHKFTPLVSETLYSAWTNQTEQISSIVGTEVIAEEPNITVQKEVFWNNPSTDNINQVFTPENIMDIDGIVRVEVTVTAKNTSRTTLMSVRNLYIEDYFDTQLFDYYKLDTDYTGSVTGLSSGAIHWTISPITTNVNLSPKDTITYKLTYYLQLKEVYWTKLYSIDGNHKDMTERVNYYINPINNLSKVKDSIINYGNEASDKLDYSNIYYSTNEGHKSYIYVHYNIMNEGSQKTTNGTPLENTERYIPYPAYDSIIIEPEDWRPETEQVQITTDTSSKNTNKNNVFKDIDAKYSNTWFVQYDTHSTTNSSNSLFKISMNSWVRRNHYFYQITDNYFDIRTTTKTQQVLENHINALQHTTASGAQDKTSQFLLGTENYRTNKIFEISSSYNERITKPISGNNVYNPNHPDKNIIKGKTINYEGSYVKTIDTIYATNQDGLKMSIYPFVRTTDTRTNPYEYFITRRNTNGLVNLSGLTLANARCDVTIDATNPIITPDSRIKTESDIYGKWTESDGYIDINLVNRITNPEPQVHELTFKFQDLVSGVNYPKLGNDWITRINDNVQVKLTNTDTGKVIFDWARDEYRYQGQGDHPIINVNYLIQDAMNNGDKSGGTIRLTLDPSNDDLLGHLKLEIKIIDNVGNWELKTYDIYSFCLTGEVNVVDTLPDSDDRKPAEIYRGEQGKVGVQADGWVDRVTLNYEQHLIKATEDDVHQRNDIFGDDYKINGDYPVDNSNLTSSQTLVPYLPKAYQKCRWGFSDGTLGGLPLTLAELAKIQDVYVNNDLLNEHLNELIDNFILIQNHGIPEDVYKSDYAIVDTTLYTYPIYNNGTLKSYAHSYSLDGLIDLDGTPHPVNVIIDGSHYATINYTRIYKTNSETGEVEEYLVPEIEQQTLFASEWVQSGGAYLRPFYHYFYMPKNAELRNGDKGDHFIVQITSYKDSHKDFKHSVTIELTFTNGDWPGNQLQTNIKDN